MVRVNNLTKLYTESAMMQSLVATCAIYGRLAEGVDGAHLHEWLLDESEHAGNANGTLESDTGASDARIAELTEQRDAALDMYEGLLRENRALQAGYDEIVGIAADLCRACGFSMVDAGGEAV